MTRPLNTDAIEKKTGQSWDEWLTFLARHQAESKTHSEIAKIVELELTGKIDSPQWWAQNITVAYEQHAGRRLPGQRGDGSFEISASTTHGGLRADTAKYVSSSLEKIEDFNDHQVVSRRTSSTPVRDYWRFTLANATNVTFSLEQKNDNKVLFVITHAHIKNAKEAEAWKVFWKNCVSDIISK